MNLAFFSGNEMYWRTRFENSTVSSTTTTTDRTLTSYKDTHYDAKVDPVQWTGTWRDPRFTTAADGITPENALIGQSFIVNSGTSAIEIPYAFSKLRMWRNTPVASLTSGQKYRSRTRRSATSGTSTPTTATGPPGSFRLSDTTRSGVETLLDFGSEFDPARHRAPQHDALQGAERSTRLRFRHRAVVVGTRYVQPDQQPRGREDGRDAAGDGEPVRRHGRRSRRR